VNGEVREEREITRTSLVVNRGGPKEKQREPGAIRQGEASKTKNKKGKKKPMGTGQGPWRK